MPDPIYFQWQNEFLLRTIYPLRETKLRDFLQFYYEIEVWQKYKNIQPQALAADTQAFRAARKGQVLEAYDLFEKIQAYFLNEDVTSQYRAVFPNPDPDIMQKINDLHRLFKRYYPTYQNPVKEKYFTSERARQFEDMRRRAQEQIAAKQRTLRNLMPGSTLKPAVEKDLARLTDLCLKMVDQELARLYDFLKAYARLEIYQQEANKRRAAGEKTRAGNAAKLNTLKPETETLEDRLAQSQQAGRRLSAPPNLEVNKAYFLDEDVSDVYRSKYPALDPGVLQKINDLHKTFKKFLPGYKNPTLEKSFLTQRIAELENIRKLRAQEMAGKQRAQQWTQPGTANWSANEKAIAHLKENILRPLDDELSKLYDLQWAYEAAAKSPAAISALIAQSQKERSTLEAQWKEKKASIAALETEQDRLGGELARGEKEIMLALVDALPVGPKDIARWKIEAYGAELEKKTLDQLLEAIVQRFISDPERYPLWLQYMVIHFSGMRYQSAHGSWADPKDLLLSLRIMSVQEELKRQGSEAINAMCDQRYQCYQMDKSASKPSTGAGDGASSPPALAATSESQWKSKIESHLKALDPERGYNRQKALLDLRIDEEDYEIEHMTPGQALEALEGMKDRLPDWMWKEIVRLTDLRLKEVKDEKWEQDSGSDAAERYSRQMEPYRLILEKWKKDHLTGWREEHDRTNRLIVTRAVCNEVAEHIQHLRGNSPSGGLTAKPEWYMRQEKDPRRASAPDRPYFVKAKTTVDFKPGASILWLQWVNKEPNAWQITRPVVLKNGEELIPQLNDGRVRITNTGNSFLRDGVYPVKDASGAVIEQRVHQWLRWLHEATVVDVAETMDGPTVLTFETALPFEDRRQSTIGVFKHAAANLTYAVTPNSMTATFIGYAPEGDVPYTDLKEMLDWNRVLLRNAYTPEQIEQYWEKVTRPPQVVSFDLGVLPEEVLFEIAPTLAPEFALDRAVCYESSPETGEMDLYRPSVALRRGTRLLADLAAARVSGGNTFLPVSQCAVEPRAEGLYIRAVEAIRVPEMGDSLPFQARADLPLYRICAVDEKGRPVFEENGDLLVRGTRLRASAIHKAGPVDKGDGTVRGKGRQSYILVNDCPRQPGVEGAFVKKSGLRKISEKHYERGKFRLQLTRRKS